MIFKSYIHKITALFILCACYSIPYSHASNLRMAKANATRFRIEQISRSIELFKFDVGKYPTEHHSLSALCEKPYDMKLFDKWNGPYLIIKQNKCVVPDDPWGNAFIYRYPGLYNKKSYDLYSMGEDEKSESRGNDADDISNWDLNENWREHYKPKRFDNETALVFIILYFPIFLLKITIEYIRKRSSVNFQIKYFFCEALIGILILMIITFLFVIDVAVLYIAIISAVATLLMSGIASYYKTDDKIKNIIELTTVANILIFIILFTEVMLKNL